MRVDVRGGIYNEVVRERAQQSPAPVTDHWIVHIEEGYSADPDDVADMLRMLIQKLKIRQPGGPTQVYLVVDQQLHSGINQIQRQEQHTDLAAAFVVLLGPGHALWVFEDVFLKKFGEAIVLPLIERGALFPGVRNVQTKYVQLMKNKSHRWVVRPRHVLPNT